MYAYNMSVKYHKSTEASKNGESMSSDTTQQCVLLVTDYVAYGTLYNLLRNTRRLNEIIARTYFKQIITAINHCHNKGIIHRNLTLKNISIYSNYDLKIAHFGYSKMIKSDSDVAMNTKVVVPKFYQSPELIKNGNMYDYKCDVFSIGFILFIVLAGC